MLVPKRKRNKRTVLEALTDLTWVRDIQGALSADFFSEYFALWDHISEVVLQPEVEDTFGGSLVMGITQQNPPMKACFLVRYFSVLSRGFENFAPGKCRFFMWLVVHERCWMADRLTRRGLPHPSCCPLCDQEEENTNHLLSTCVFAREFWFFLLR